MSKSKAVETALAKQYEEGKAAGQALLARLHDDPGYLAKAAAEEASYEKVLGNVISTAGGVFKYAGQDLGDSIDVVVLGSVYEHAHYASGYDPKNPEKQPPDCYSLSVDYDAACPNGPEETRIALACKECPFNQFGSEPKRGRGKACLDRKRLVVVGAGQGETALTADSLKRDAALLKVPPTSVRAWAGYVRAVKDAKSLPVWAVSTRIQLKPLKDGGFEMAFTPIAAIPEGLLAIAYERRATVEELLMQPYPLPRPPLPAVAKGKSKRA